MYEFFAGSAPPTPERDDTRSLQFGTPAHRSALLLVFLGLFFFSFHLVSNVAVNFHISTYLRNEAVMAVPAIALATAVAGTFLTARFSFGYLAGFYLFAMMAGYFWLNTFGTLGYDRPAALLSATASILCFLAPALLITQPARRFFSLPHRAFDALPAAILGLSALVFLVSASNGIRLVGLSDMYKFRDTLDHSRAFYYFVGIFHGALMPFAFACFLARKRWLMLAALCVVSVLFYLVTLTKVSLFLSFMLIFIATLSAYFEPRAVVILSLCIPTAIGMVSRAFGSDIAVQMFGFLSFRLLAVPSISLDHYYVFFADHPLTHFCQIAFTKPFMACPYSDPLGTVLSNWFGLGSMNASLFATEGVASVGPLFAPLSALVCGLVIAIGNMVSAGLPNRFILISAASVAHILLNVPLATTLVTYGLGVLFLLWYVTPRDYFEVSAAGRQSSENQPAIDHQGLADDVGR
jgi:hypothetical protein